jgi:hypothetical protein
MVVALSFLLNYSSFGMRNVDRFEIEISVIASGPSMNFSGQCGSLPDDRNIQERDRTV